MEAWLLAVIIISVCIGLALIIYGAFRLYKYYYGDNENETDDDEIQSLMDETSDTQIPLHPQIKANIRKSISKNFKHARKKRSKGNRRASKVIHGHSKGRGSK